MKMASEKQGRERRRIKKLTEKEIRGEVPSGTVENSFVSWKANAERGDTYFQVKRMERVYQDAERRIKNGN